MTNELSRTQNQYWDEKQMSIIRSTICKNCSDDEITLFSYICQRTGLDPFARQIYAVKRGNNMTIQTGIDGFRLIAERTNKYSPGREYTFEYDNTGKLLRATAYIKKQTQDGTWHEVSASAYYSEFVQEYNGKPSNFWARMPHVMLGKVAESICLRKAFPADLSGLYTDDEMSQADSKAIDVKPIDDRVKPEPEEEFKARVDELLKLVDLCPPERKTNFYEIVESKGWAHPYDMTEKFLELQTKQAKNYLERIQKENTMKMEGLLNDAGTIS